VGFAFAARRPVHAFEIDPFERRYMRRMARLNNVEHCIKLDGWCSPDHFKKICPDRSFILCDCEGYETELFLPSVVLSLRHSDLIIELHPAGQYQTSAQFLDRFSATHQLEYVSSRPRYAASRSELARLGLLDD